MSEADVRNHIDCTQGKVFLNNVECMDAVSLTFTFSPITSSTKTLGHTGAEYSLYDFLHQLQTFIRPPYRVLTWKYSFSAISTGLMPTLMNIESPSDFSRSTRKSLE